MRARVLDTSILIASVDEDDERKSEALRRVTGPGPAVVPNEVLIETLGTLKRLQGRGAAKQFQDAMRKTEGIEMGHESDMDASLDLLDQFPKLSIVDACAVTLAWRLGAELDTFDDAQRKVWATR